MQRTAVNPWQWSLQFGAFLANFGPIAGRFGEAGARYASTLLGVARLAFPELLVELEATAIQ